MKSVLLVNLVRAILLVLLITLLFFPTPWQSLGFALAPVYFILRRRVQDNWFPQTRANFFILLLFVMSMIGFAVSPARESGVSTFGILIAGLSVFAFVFDETKISGNFSSAAKGLVVLGCLIALAAPFVTTPSLEPLLGSLAIAVSQAVPKTEHVTNQNSLAGGLVILAPFALVLLTQKEWRWRILGLFAFPLMVFAILFLESRGALFALALGVATWLTLYRRWVLPLVPLVVIALLLWNQAWQGPSIGQVLYGSIGSSKSGTFIERTELWAQAALLIRNSPLVGIGLGAYTLVAPTAFPYSPENPGRVQNHAHNLFFQVALDAGIPGAIAFIALIFIAMRGAWRAYHVRFERDVAIGLLAAFVILTVHGMGEVGVWGSAKPGVILWIFLAMGNSFDKSSQVM